MDENKFPDNLQQIPADRKLVEKLYSHGKISGEAREYALNLLYPKNWGLWISRMLLIFGTALILSGIVYFAAFNWQKIPYIVKLFSIQLSMMGCIVGAYYFTLDNVIGKILLLSSSIIVGVFMAVFGQIYQTGADSYQLFLMWSVLILGWTLISNFAGQWLVWLVVTNLAIILWGEKSVIAPSDFEDLVPSYLIILNATFLVLREYFAIYRRYEWLSGEWTQIILVAASLLTMLKPIAIWIMADLEILFVAPRREVRTPIMHFNAIIGLIGHVLMYYFYRYKLQNIKLLAMIILSIGMILEVIALKLFLSPQHVSDILITLVGMILSTITIFRYAILHIKHLSHRMEG